MGSGGLWVNGANLKSEERGTHGDYWVSHKELEAACCKLRLPLGLGVGLGLYDKNDNYSILENGSFKVFPAAGEVGGCSVFFWALSELIIFTHSNCTNHSRI